MAGRGTDLAEYRRQKAGLHDALAISDEIGDAVESAMTFVPGGQRTA